MAVAVRSRYNAVGAVVQLLDRVVAMQAVCCARMWLREGWTYLM